MPLFTPELEFSDDYPTIEPSLRLDFANARALDPRITFTRASVATYVGKDGLIKTAGENEARFDHDPTTGESLGLLIEESRTNEVLNSQVFTTGWNTSGIDTITQNTTVTTPEGLTDGVGVITESSGGTVHQFYEASSAQITGTRTYSIFVKPNGRNYCVLMTSSFTHDLVNGTTLGSASGEYVSATTTKFANGWVRCTLTRNHSNSYDQFNFKLAKDGHQDYSYSGDGTSGVYVWGAQLEEGSFPTSYIPTSGATVTREKEFPAIETSSIDFNDFSRGGEGTLVCEFSNAGDVGSDVAVCFSGDTHNGATFVGLGTNSNRNPFNRNRVNATNTVLSVDTNFTTTGFYKIAFGIGQSRCTLAVRGSSSGVIEDTSVSYDSTPYTKLILGCDQTSSSINNMINGTIKSVFYYPTLLTDTQLQTLTQ